MSDSPIMRAEHEEFVRRMEEEHKRQNKRLDLLEKQTEQITVKQMAEEQREQGNRLEKLEGRDGEMWRKVVGYVITAVIGILIGFVFRQIGM